jgi:hypothetical protein
MQRRKTIGNSFGFIEPSESRLRRDTDALNYPNGPYSPECVEEEFSEVRSSKGVFSERTPTNRGGAVLAAFVKSVAIKDTNLRRKGKPMRRLENQELEMAELRSDLSARELWEVEDYFRKQGVSEFIYDEPIDVFRFPEDGRFAFCEAFADWERLQERGYLHLLDEYRDDLKGLRAPPRQSEREGT